MLQYVSVETLRNRRNFVRYTQCLRELRSDHHKCYEIARLAYLGCSRVDIAAGYLLFEIS